MKTEKIKIWGDQDEAYLQAYLLHDSKEFNQQKKRPAVIICPGGAYLGTSDREAEPVALRFAAQGYQTFVLRYRTYFTEFSSNFNPKNEIPVNPRSLWPNPLYDLAKSISLIRQHANEWLVDTDHIAICGFSAGGNLVGHLATHWHDPELAAQIGVESNMLKPNAVIMGYPVLDYFTMVQINAERNIPLNNQIWRLSNTAVFGVAELSAEQLNTISPITAVSQQTAPCFIWHTASDELVYVENSLTFAMALSKHKIPYAMHIFESGPHGLSLADDTSADSPELINPDAAVWFDLVLTWLKKH
ncbi:MAG: alpha/beta hydrolase [Eubacteriales bacterium]|nr:alpha/beta hydrolase [Eubacteriales bacterium]